MTTLSDAARNHVASLTRTWLGLAPGADVPAMPDPLMRRLLRVEELEHSHRDQWGNWEFPFCEAYREGLLWQPDVDRWLRDCRREAGVEGRTPWPDGRPFAICLSHDVDLISDAVTPGQALRSMRLALLGGDRAGHGGAVRFARPGVRAARALRHGVSKAPAADALERCLGIEEQNGVTATYFFTAYPGGDGHRFDCVYDFGDRCRFRGTETTVADVVRTVDRDGFEVGLHGSFNSALVAGRLAAEKAMLEKATGLSVASTRQHFLHWDVRTTPALHAAAGFSADSTLGFNRNIGFRSGTSLPFRMFDFAQGRAVETVELPIAISDPALLRSDALELGIELGPETLRSMLDRVADVAGVATVVFHPNNLDQPDYLRLFEDVIAYGRERDAWFASVGEIDAWFRARDGDAPV